MSAAEDMQMPTALVSEQSALGAILAAPNGAVAAKIAEQVFALAPPPAFYRPAHQIVAGRIQAMLLADQVIDPTLLSSALAEHGELSKVGAGPYLHTLMERGWDPGNAELYAEEVREAWLRRRGVERSTRAAHMFGNVETDYGMAVAELAAGVDDAEAAMVAARPILVPTVGDLLEELSDEPDWVVPGLLARRERIMLTGLEGLGKTELIMQVATCAALGIHPFTGQPLPKPCRVLHVDAENEREELRPRYRRVVTAAEWIGKHHGLSWDRDRLLVETRTEGLDLTHGDDVGWLDRVMTATRPDLLIIGPLYKLHLGNMNEETAARQLTATLDRLRVQHAVALLIEAHAGQSEDLGGKRKLRPRGSSLFRGWPNVGIGIRPHKLAQGERDLVEVERWRGFRAERDWPMALQQGPSHALPWAAVSKAELARMEGPQ